jgi:hypothetical protein
MTRTQRIVHVTHGQYYLSELNAISTLTTDMYSGFNGLISSNGALGIVMTGTESGPVSVTADWRARQCEPDLDAWDEVVEISMRFGRYPAELFGPEDSKADIQAIPSLPPGTYRVRAHARGRDAAHSLRRVAGESVEEHLVVAWPAPPGPEVRYKLTDDYGASIRAR